MLAACTSSAPTPDSMARAPLFHERAVGNVYVTTTQYGTGSRASGKDRILRFAAGMDTSTPNMAVELRESPSIGLAVSPRDGRVAIVFSNGRVQIRTKNLEKLYEIGPSFGSYGFPLSVAYDNAGNLWIGGWLGTDMGELYEYYGNDTEPDNTYHIPNASMDEPPYSVAFDKHDNLYVEGRFHVWIDCNTATGCVNTAIPSFSRFLDEYYAYLAEIALLDGSKPRLVEATPKNYIKYYSPPASGPTGNWIQTGRSKRCSSAKNMFIGYLAADTNDTLYLTCEVSGAGSSGGSANGTSLILELHRDGSRNVISGLTNPDGAVAY